MEPLWLVAVLLLLGSVAIIAYSLRALDAAGSVASFVLGLVVALVGGLGWLGLMMLFPVVGVVVTRVGYARKRERRVEEGNEGERSLANVVGNGLAATLACVAVLASPIVPRDAASLAFATALAAATADTMASELGTLARRAYRILPPYRAVPVGENGAVSVPGTAMAAVGAAGIAALAVPLTGIGWGLAAWAALGGFLGCQLDSVLGATLERDVVRPGPLSKQDVNFIASAVPAAAALVAGTFLLR